MVMHTHNLRVWRHLQLHIEFKVNFLYMMQPCLNTKQPRILTSYGVRSWGGCLCSGNSECIYSKPCHWRYKGDRNMALAKLVENIECHIRLETCHLLEWETYLHVSASNCLLRPLFLLGTEDLQVQLICYVFKWQPQKHQVSERGES